MRLGFRTRQVIVVTGLVTAAMLAVAALHLTSIVGLRLEETAARGDLLARALFHRARLVVPSADDAQAALRDDASIRTILESSIAYTRNVTHASILDADGVAIAHSSPSLEGLPQPDGVDVEQVLARGTAGRLRAVYSDATLEIARPILLGDDPFGSIRIGLSTALLRDELSRSMRAAAATLLLVVVVAVLASAATARWALAPIHVMQVQSRTGRVTPDAHSDEEPGDRPQDAPGADADAEHDAGSRAGRASESHASPGRLMAGVAHEVKNPLNAMTIHLELLRQKLSALSAPREHVETGSVLGLGPDGRPARPADASSRAAGVTSAPVAVPRPDELLQHVVVIENEIRRLDEVIQGFLHFIRPEAITREPVALAEVVDEVLALVEPDARRNGVTLENRCDGDAPRVVGDPALLRQALMNLALNACQAMDGGGRIEIGVARVGSESVDLEVRDTGPGMTPEVLERIFDLYYTTRAEGSGIGLSMVYRIVQLHHGDITVESTPGAGTRFVITLPRHPAQVG